MIRGILILDRDNEDVHFDDESARVVISSLRLDDDQGSLITNSSWFAFRDNRFDETPVSVLPTGMMDVINLNGNPNGSNDISNDKAMVGKNEEFG